MKLFGILLLFFTFSVNAQNLGWVNQMGGIGNGEGRSICTDPQGNIYTTGWFDGTTDFDPGSGVFNLTSAGMKDFFIQKLDSLGNLIWAKHISGSSQAEGTSIIIDNQGFIYVGGNFAWTVDFDPGIGVQNLTSGGNGDAIILKLDSLGNFIWVKQFSGPSRVNSPKLALDSLGNIYAVGSFEGMVDFDPGSNVFNLISAGQNDIYIVKLNDSGNMQWAHRMGGGGDDYAQSVTTDANANVYTTGSFGGMTDFDPGPAVQNLTPTGSSDIFIQKLNTSGDYVWTKQMGGNITSSAYGITYGSYGSIYTTGRFHGFGDFDTGLGTYSLSSDGPDDVFIHKLDTAGKFIWVKQMGGPNNEVGQSIAVDTKENVYSTGYFQDTVDFNPNTKKQFLQSNGLWDIFVQKLDRFGNFVWAKRMGGISWDFARDITVGSTGNIYTTGGFYGSVDFDPNFSNYPLTSVDLLDIFVHEFDQCSTQPIIDYVEACDSFIWRDGRTYYTDNKIASFTLMNSYNCDSIIYLDLMVNSVSDLSLSSQIGGTSITASNAYADRYQWLYCDNNYSAILGENTQHFTALVNGYYAVEISENGCVDTSDCVLISSVNMEENPLSELKIFPNPSDGSFKISLGEKLISEVIIHDIRGKIVAKRKNVRQTAFNLHLNPGVYFAHVFYNNVIAVQRLVIK